MIDVLANSKDNEAVEYVMAALKRSVSVTQVRQISLAELGKTTSSIVVAISPSKIIAEQLLVWLQKKTCKLLIFGVLDQEFHKVFKCRNISWPDGYQKLTKSAVAQTARFAESRAGIRYTKIAKQLGVNNWYRAFERFDFTDEWNNLGYGAIQMNESIWSVASAIEVATEYELASIEFDGKQYGTYSALVNNEINSILWFNRPVGPIDSFEWRAIEHFLSSLRHDELPCQPVLLEIPWGYDAAITMRLDCDEDVESARELRAAYLELNVPFSLAVHTKNLSDEKNHPLIQEMVANNESVLSHTATHAHDWGGTYEAAYDEGKVSSQALCEVTGKQPTYAVSPFHQTPPYSLLALSDLGYQGCIGGIIRNDPEFLIARGGYLANLPEGFVGHSQQCMLHGDCLLEEGEPLTIYKLAFDRAFETQTLFGYLDHPFSERYQYGWKDESTRIKVHREFIGYIVSQTKTPIFMSENAAMDFLQQKMLWRVISIQDDFYVERPKVNHKVEYVPTFEYLGRQFAAVEGILS